MPKKKNLIEKLYRKPYPKNFTTRELDALMSRCNCTKFQGGRGSGIGYVHNPSKRIVQFDGPHPGNELYKYQIEKIKKFIDEIGDKIFVGEVFGIADSLNFHGRSIDELEEAFHDSIENYLEICEKIGKNPQKEFSGTFNVRTTPALHEQAAEYAADNGITLNQTISRALESFLGKQVKV